MSHNKKYVNSFGGKYYEIMKADHFIINWNASEHS